MSTAERNAELARRVVADPRWATVVARDATADGHFVYSVRTTGVYCRPSCASRRARPENVRFHATREAAERAGFPALQALPSGSSESDRAARGTDHAGLPRDRGRGARAVAGNARSGGRHERLALPSRLQGGHRAHAAWIRAGASRPPCAPGAHSRGQRHRCDLRGGLQLERAVLCGGQCASRHDAVRLPRRGRGNTDPLCRRRMLAWVDPGRRERAWHLRDPAWRRSGYAWGVVCRTSFRRRSWWAATRTSSASWRASSVSSRRRRSASTCRSTCAARPSSSASGRRCARCPLARRRATPRSHGVSARRAPFAPSRRPARQTGLR